jgi:hypothetical protein
LSASIWLGAARHVGGGEARQRRQLASGVTRREDRAFTGDLGRGNFSPAAVIKIQITR